MIHDKYAASSAELLEAIITNKDALSTNVVLPDGTNFKVGESTAMSVNLFSMLNSCSIKRCLTSYFYLSEKKEAK